MDDVIDTVINVISVIVVLGAFLWFMIVFCGLIWDGLIKYNWEVRKLVNKEIKEMRQKGISLPNNEMRLKALENVHWNLLFSTQERMAEHTRRLLLEKVNEEIDKLNKEI